LHRIIKGLYICINKERNNEINNNTKPNEQQRNLNNVKRQEKDNCNRKQAKLQHRRRSMEGSQHSGFLLQRKIKQ